MPVVDEEDAVQVVLERHSPDAQSTSPPRSEQSGLQVSLVEREGEPITNLSPSSQRHSSPSQRSLHRRQNLQLTRRRLQLSSPDAGAASTSPEPASTESGTQLTAPGATRCEQRVELMSALDEYLFARPSQTPTARLGSAVPPMQHQDASPPSLTAREMQMLALLRGMKHEMLEDEDADDDADDDAVGTSASAITRARRANDERADVDLRI